jgi:hydrogenase maturation protease
LVIGYGNSLRRDDAIGVMVADAVERRSDPRIRTTKVPQLTPDLCAELTSFEVAIFVDARLDRPEAGVLCEEIVPSGDGQSATIHAIDPRWLVSLTQAVYGRCARCWMVSLPTEDHGFGEGLSSLAERSIPDALAMIAGLIDDETGNSEPDHARSCPERCHDHHLSPRQGPEA